MISATPTLLPDADALRRPRTRLHPSPRRRDPTPMGAPDRVIVRNRDAGPAEARDHGWPRQIAGRNVGRAAAQQKLPATQQLAIPAQGTPTLACPATVVSPGEHLRERHETRQEKH